MFHIMKTASDFEAALEASQHQPIVIFKHSASCPFSGAAQIEAAHAKHDLEIYGIVVQYAPELKEAIAERLDVEHKSPQAIVVHRGKATADFWRSAIKERQLRISVKEVQAAK